MKNVHKSKYQDKTSKKLQKIMLTLERTLLELFCKRYNINFYADVLRHVNI
jgi:hypothetical protein